VKALGYVFAAAAFVVLAVGAYVAVAFGLDRVQELLGGWYYAIAIVVAVVIIFRAGALWAEVNERQKSRR
jgi:hypothetical protein